MATTQAPLNPTSSADEPIADAPAPRSPYTVGGGERPHIPASRKNATKVEASVIINRPPQEVFDFWKDVRNHPKFLHKLKRVEPVDDKHSHWVMTSFYDVDVEWDAEIINEHEGELIAWCTVGKPLVQQAGTVRFNPVPGNPNQTHLRLLATVVPPPGMRGVVGVMTAALFFQDPERALKEDLQHLKEILESPDDKHPIKIEQ